jgi:hypothetical protein
MCGGPTVISAVHQITLHLLESSFDVELRARNGQVGRSNDSKAIQIYRSTQRDSNARRPGLCEGNGVADDMALELAGELVGAVTQAVFVGGEFEMNVADLPPHSLVASTDVSIAHCLGERMDGGYVGSLLAWSVGWLKCHT